MSVTAHEIQDREASFLRCLGFKVRETDWEQRDLSSTEAEVAVLWVARLFAVMPPPWPCSSSPGHLGCREHSPCTERQLLLCRASPQAVLVCLPYPWCPTQCGTHSSGFCLCFSQLGILCLQSKSTLLHFNSHSSILIAETNFFFFFFNAKCPTYSYIPAYFQLSRCSHLVGCFLQLWNSQIS